MMKASLVLFTTAVLLAGDPPPAGGPEPAATTGKPEHAATAGRPEHASPARVPSWELSLLPAEPDSGTLVIEGRVLHEDGTPARDLRIHVYHADRNGSYTSGAAGRPSRSGLLRTNVLGQYRVITDLPGMAEGSPHVHFEVELPGLKYRAIPLNLARDMGAGSDTRLARLPWMVLLPDTALWGYVKPGPVGGFRCRWDLRLARAFWIGKRPEAFDTR